MAYPKPYMHPFSKPAAVPVATGGKVQPESPHGPKLKKITVRAHTRTVKPKPAAAPGLAAPPVDPNAALLAAATHLRFGPQEQAYGQQLQQNARFSSGVNDWYANAMKEIQGLKAQGQAQGAQTLAAVQNYNSTPTVNNPMDQQAANARNALNSQYGAMVGRDSNANAAAMDRITAAYGTQQGNTQNAANAERMRLLAGQTALKGQEGDFKLQYGEQQDAAKAKAEVDAANLAIKQGTLDYLTGNSKSLAQDRVAGQKVARTNARTQRANAKETVRQHDASNALGHERLTLDQWKAVHPSAGKKGAGSNATYSKSKIQGFRSNWEYAKATAHQLKEKGTYVDKNKKTQNISTDVAYSALLNATKDPDIAKAAALAAFGKSIPADLRHRLAVKGVHPPEPKVGKVKGGGPYGTGNLP